MKIQDLKVIENQNGQQAVSARLLHQFLEVNTEFAKWASRMFEYGFTEKVDYELVIVKNDENSKGADHQQIMY